MSSAVDQHTLRPLVAGPSAWIGADLASGRTNGPIGCRPPRSPRSRRRLRSVLGRDIADDQRAPISRCRHSARSWIGCAMRC